MDYLSEDRIEIRYTLPLTEIVFDFFDQLKSMTRGYASLDYEPIGEEPGDLVKVDILLQGEKGKHSNKILKAAERAKSKKLGLWRKCPKLRYK